MPHVKMVLLVHTWGMWVWGGREGGGNGKRKGPYTSTMTQGCPAPTS